MSAKGMTATVIATFLAKAVADDEAGEGCDLSAGVFGPAVSALIREIAEQMTAPQKPIDMILHCPACLEQHIDAPDEPDKYCVTTHDGGCESTDPRCMHQAEPTPRWTNPPHRSHKCQHCGFQWRPADVATNGVAAIKTKGKDDSPNTTPLWFLADETDDAQDDVWIDAADAYAKAAGCLRGHLEWRDRIRAAVRVLLAGRLP